ncbi:interference hedgehog-like [Ctenocephalides felis]|uniref:interference hedgehog-like n=1 Tax=Ctenocephalides felis TaxID=7515 RepID=UPI000E6E3F5F|nr:interference hedgehog-like [Ctenocephalides felis]
MIAFYIPDPTRPADGFYLYFRPASTAGEYVKETVDGERSRVHRIEHLTPDTTYEVKVQSFTADGASDFSAILTQRTMKQPTEPPTPMVILDHRPSSAASASASSGSSVVNMNETMDKDKNRQGDSSSGALAVGGGTAGGLAAVLVLGAAAIYALRKKKREKNERDHSERDEGDEDGRISSDNKDGDFANIQDKQEGHISESNGYITASAINPHNSYQLKTVQITANGCARVNITSNPLAEEQSDKNASVTLTELEMEMSLLSQNNNMSGSSSGSAANNSDSMDKRQYSGAACPGHGQPPLHKKMMRNGGLQVSRRNEVNMNSNSSIENYV